MMITMNKSLKISIPAPVRGRTYLLIREVHGVIFQFPPP